MSAKTTFERLFQPGRIGTLQLKNRVVMPAMVTQFPGVFGEVTDTVTDWYVRRARGGAGLLIEAAQATTLDPIRYVQVLRADDDCYAPGLARLTEAVHDAGSRIAVQLSPGAGAQGGGGLPWTPGLQHIQEVQPIGPSEVASPAVGVRPRALTIKEIEKIVEVYGFAAGRVARAGFDAIEIHAHGGYLVAEFMSAYFNKRRDRYGGELEGRLRFLLELVEAIRKNTGPGFPIVVRYSIDEFIEGGRDIRESQLVAQRLQKAGVDAIDVSSGIYGAKLPATPPMYYPEGCFVYFGEALKQVVQIPIIVAGRLGNPILAEQVLREGKADFIGLGRPLIADPDWPLKVAAGLTKEIRPCIACNECRENLMRKKQLRCTVNPVAGREGKYDVVKPSEKAKRVIVVGAGPAGMEAARVAGIRGHSVTLYEKASQLQGGQLKLASRPPHKEGLQGIVDYYSVMLRQLGNVRVQLGKMVAASLVTKEKPDAVLIATGGIPIVPDIPGVDRANVVSAFDVLAGKARPGRVVVVVGGGSVGCETANLLARQKRSVTIVEILNAAGADMERMSWIALREELSQNHVNILTGVRPVEITDAGIVLVDKKSRRSTLQADTVVLALGVKPVGQLAAELRDKVEELYLIGDAKQPGKLRDAISDGYVTAYNI